VDNRIPKSIRRNKILFLLLGGTVGIVLLVISGYQLVEFTDSTGFCGRLCHNVMSPEYTVHQISPHSSVTCATCHVGSGASYLVKSKISGIPLIIAVLTNSYERPIPTPVSNLRPARETCEQCHRPQYFAGDLVKTHITYAPDQANTQTTDVRTMRVGGGETGVASGIHWHVAAQVNYVPGDNKLQTIDWVGVTQADGSTVTYTNPGKTTTPDQIKKSERLLDCIDCHNRATHIFNSPNDLIDAAMFQGKIDKTLPFIKKVGLQALDPVNSSLSAAISKVDAIRDYYRSNYPDIFQKQAQSIDNAVAELENIARETTFPEMKVDWNTYPNNATHQGCFRCHGKLVDQGGKVLTSDCTLCHYNQSTVTAASGPAAPPPAVTTTTAGTNAPAIPHSLAGRDNCLACHGTGGIVPVPGDHAGRAVNTCLACHKSA
jgi:hypothetical protein